MEKTTVPGESGGVHERFAEIEKARAEYARLLTYAIEGCRHLLWKTAFDLNRPEVSATQAQEIVSQLGQMANDLDRYEAEAERLGLGT